MNVSDEATKLRIELLRLGGGGERRRYPPGTKESILKFIDEAKQAGMPVGESCRRLGLSTRQVGNWRAEQRRAKPHALVPVRVIDVPMQTQPLAVLAPNGYRVEGATVEQVIALMQALA